MKVTLGLKQTQKLSLTPQLQQAIHLLQLPTLDLVQEINDTLEQNPILEIIDPPYEESPTKLERSQDTDNKTGTELNNHEETSTDEFQDWSKSSSNSESPIDWIEAHVSLSEHLRQQMRCLHLSLTDQAIIDWLIGSLDENGVLVDPLEKLAKAAPFGQDLDLDDWKAALRLLQSFDPAGIASKNIEECLYLQLSSFNSKVIDKTILDLAKNIVLEHLELAAKRNFSELKKILSCNETNLKEALTLIGQLNPHPGAQFKDISINYVIPEVIVYRTDNQWRVRLSQQASPRLQINQTFVDAINASKSPDNFKVWQNKLTEARFFIRNIEQRQATIVKVATAIVKEQQAFFNEGASAMKPLVLREIADEIGMHESTVSRVTNGKYLRSPQGVFELKYFFSSSIQNNDGNNTSATAIKAQIKAIISEENPKKPLSDSKIAELLKLKGIIAARRTIAKYREALGISPASQRKNL